MNVAEERDTAVRRLIEEASAKMAQDGSGPDTLSHIRQMVASLAQRANLFRLQDFALPTEGKSQRYKLGSGADDRFVLYLNTVLPGKSTFPHNHKTWAIVASVLGQERNRIYKRKVDASGQPAGIELVGEKIVGPGDAVLFDPEDIHSVHYEDVAPGVQIHFYGQALETLSNRSGFDADGNEVNYNKSMMKPTAGKV
ncbi:MAG: hypothetical protein KF735_22265 [Chelatococcus sp.]|jgi:predicted metal-dependent enzyme (double-stranded beta helix superfamily)|uniref:cysteine dioxygenase family protein n=1 Tax=Chelatococcus sp. TaxID=1953771 RepID=UPI0025C50984|nr:hypothetical protein [Chelatococcus sp.]MBX3540382.1 hypothetical protein [Chelatococcus sp.]